MQKFSGLIAFPTWESALPLLNNRIRILELCDASPGGTLHLLIGSHPFTLNKASVLAFERLILEQNIE